MAEVFSFYLAGVVGLCCQLGHACVWQHQNKYLPKIFLIILYVALLGVTHSRLELAIAMQLCN